ncbi:MAG: hemerythrin domain-containing protein [Agriterribacter sp.]
MMYREFAYQQIISRYGKPEFAGNRRQFMESLASHLAETSFSVSDYESYSIEVLLEYITSSHQYYLCRRLPEIEQTIEQLSALYPTAHPLILLIKRLFHAYCTAFRQHIDQEETELLPYVRILLACLKNDDPHSIYSFIQHDYRLSEFTDNHSDTEEGLQQLCDAIHQYQPPETNASVYRILLFQLTSFQHDLMLHSQIEEEVLIPRAIEMENGLLGKWLSVGASFRNRKTPNH